MQFHIVLLCLYIADPADPTAFLALEQNLVLLRTACLFSYEKDIIYTVDIQILSLNFFSKT